MTKRHGSQLMESVTTVAGGRMISRYIVVSWIVAGIALLPVSALAAGVPSNDTVVSAANRFLDTLTQVQRQKVVYPYNDAAQRARWSNFPTGIVARGGISLKEMSAPQQEAALSLLRTVLSPMGYEKVDQIRMADDDFKENGSKRGPPRGGSRGPRGVPRNAPLGPPPGPPLDGEGGRPPPGGLLFGSDLYYISFLGQPSVQRPWSLQFGGHHLALNITIAAGNGDRRAHV